jgi:hypothetical protein
LYSILKIEVKIKREIIQSQITKAELYHQINTAAKHKKAIFEGVSINHFSLFFLSFINKFFKTKSNIEEINITFNKSKSIFISIIVQIQAQIA